MSWRKQTQIENNNNNKETKQCTSYGVFILSELPLKLQRISNGIIESFGLIHIIIFPSQNKKIIKLQIYSEKPNCA